MKNIFEQFRKKYKFSVEPLKNENNDEEKAQKLVNELNSVFVILPLLKPYKDGESKVKLQESHIQTIEEVLNTDNKFITKNENYLEIRKILEDLLIANKTGIEIDRNFLNNAKKVQKFFYGIQGEKYWSEKSF